MVRRRGSGPARTPSTEGPNRRLEEAYSDHGKEFPHGRPAVQGARRPWRPRPLERRRHASLQEILHRLSPRHPWDRLHLGYFLGYALWNYLTSPFLFTRPGVEAREIEPWHEAGQEWRRLRVRFPDTVTTHNPEQVFYYDTDFMQRRMDYVTEILGGTLVAHYSGRPKTYGGFVFPTWRRVFRRNQDGTSNLNLPSITIDIDDITINRGGSS